MISATIAGNIVRDAELKRTKDGGDAILEFTVASNEVVKGEKVATFVRCSLWGKRGEVLAQYVTKGSRVCCTGLLSVRPYVSQGESKYSVELKVHHVELMGGGQKHKEDDLDF